MVGSSLNDREGATDRALWILWQQIGMAGEEGASAWRGPWLQGTSECGVLGVGGARTVVGAGREVWT